MYDSAHIGFSTGIFDASELLATMDQQIAAARKDAESRKEIMEKMEKWMSACEEETWLEDYNRVHSLLY